jgi:hypothetical protein
MNAGAPGGLWTGAGGLRLVIAVVGTVILARKPRKGELTGSAQ